VSQVLLCHEDDYLLARAYQSLFTIQEWALSDTARLMAAALPLFGVTSLSTPASPLAARLREPDGADVTQSIYSQQLGMTRLAVFCCPFGIAVETPSAPM